MSENVFTYINKMPREEFKKFKKLSDTKIFGTIISEIRAEQYADSFQQQCRALGTPEEYIENTKKMILLARAIAARYIREK